MKRLDDYVIDLLEAATQSEEATEAMKYAQAALNAANAISSIYYAETLRHGDSLALTEEYSRPSACPEEV